MSKSTEVLYLEFAEGSVDPAARIESGEIELVRVEELEAGIKAGKYTKNDADQHAIPCGCMDCRAKAADGLVVEGAKAAGGTTTLVAADAMTSSAYRKHGEKAPAHKKRLFKTLIKSGRKVGGHTATTVPHEGYAGCGAEDKLDDTAEPGRPSILNFLVRKSQPIFDTIRSLGVSVSEETQAEITANTQGLIDEKYATTGQELSKAGIEAAQEEGVDPNVVELEGPQNGVIVAILTQPGTYLDQKAIREEFGDKYEVFEISAWAIKNGAVAIAENEQDAHEKEVAALAYNLAAGGVIAGPGMRVVVI